MADAARTKPIEDVRDISAITYGFMASKALFSALEFDIFTRIAEGANSTSALAKVTGIAENRLLALLASLKSLGLISETDGRLINAPATSRYLVAGAPGDFRDYVQFVNGAAGYESFRHLDKALRGERVFPDKGWYEGFVYDSGIGGERFSSAQHMGSLGPARLMAKRVDLKDRRKLLDAGGGSGAYSIAFCNANPQLSRRAADALPTGGLLLVHDFMVDNARDGPRFAAWYLLGSILDNPSAVCLTPAYVENVLRDSGFTIENTETMLPGITMLTKAVKA